VLTEKTGHAALIITKIGDSDNIVKRVKQKVQVIKYLLKTFDAKLRENQGE